MPENGTANCKFAKKMTTVRANMFLQYPSVPKSHVKQGLEELRMDSALQELELLMKRGMGG